MLKQRPWETGTSVMRGYCTNVTGAVGSEQPTNYKKGVQPDISATGK